MYRCKGLDCDVPSQQVLLFTAERGTLMPTKEESRYRSSSWWDVKVYCLEVSKAHNGYCVVHASPNMPERVNKAMCWQVCWYPRGRAVSEGYQLAVSDYWPHTDYKVVTDLLMKLIYDLDWRLTDRQVRAEQAAMF